MPRQNKYKNVSRMPRFQSFGPAGCSFSPEDHKIILNVEEYEALRLIDYEGLTQEACAERMEVGRATVQALYAEARKKVARLLVEGVSLQIEGGTYRLQEQRPERAESQKGGKNMKLAVTYDNGQIYQHFGHTEQFKIYETEDGKIQNSEIVDTNGTGHGALAGFLKERGVEVLICGNIGGGARNALAEAGIRLFPGAAGDADAQVESFLAGSLNYDPDAMCSHHGAGHSCHDHGTDHACHDGAGHHGGCAGHGHGCH
ncbi:MAG TPA: DUF134 domain-containing protein [Firmicutes bacterium]|nr:DUF134 domain-containing protein [Bacillota bacterium]